MLQGNVPVLQTEGVTCTKAERLSREGRKCWRTAARLGRGVRAENTCGGQGRQKSDGQGGPAGAVFSDRERFLEVDAAWII